MHLAIHLKFHLIRMWKDGRVWEFYLFFGLYRNVCACVSVTFFPMLMGNVRCST